MITSMPRIAVAVPDFDATVARFRDELGMPVVDLSAQTVASLGAKLAMCVPIGGSNIEIMSPATPGAPLSDSLQRFLDRRGEGLYAMMLEAPDPDAEAAAMTERGAAVLPLMEGAGGRDVHPRSTHGVLIRVYPNGSFPEPNDRESKAPFLSGVASVIVATDDADKAAYCYREQLGLDVSAASLDTDRGVMVATGRPPQGGVIELVSPADNSRAFSSGVTSFLTDASEGMMALALKSAEPEAANEALSPTDVGFGDSLDTGIIVAGTRFVLR